MLNYPLELLLPLVLAIIISLSVHEFSHALAADQLGDDTPRLEGRLTLNPLAHLDLMGSLMFIIAVQYKSIPTPFSADIQPVS